MIVTVRFKNVVVGGTVSDGTTTPVESFILGSWEYAVDLTGQLQPTPSAAGDQYKYLVDANSHRWRYSSDLSGAITKEDLGTVTSPRTFWMMLGTDGTIWIIGADLTGEFDLQYLQ